MKKAICFLCGNKTRHKDYPNKILVCEYCTIELVKNQLVNKHYELQIVWKTMTNSLEEKYGSVSINLENGLFTSNEE